MNFGKKLRAAIAVAASSALLIGGVSAPAQAAKTDTLTIGAVAPLTSWEPSQANIGHPIQFYQAVYDTLVLRDSKGNYKPNLASSWTFNTARTQVTLKLRTDVTFTDGAKFDANAAKKNLDAFISGNGPQAGSFAGARVSIVAPDRIRITLSKANPDILYYLSTTNSFMASPKAVGTPGLKTTPVGSGPYIYDKSSVAGSQIVLTANPNYWDKSKIKFKKIVFKVMTDVNARLNALVSGQIDATILDSKTAPVAKQRKMTEYRYAIDWKGLLLLDRDGKVNKALGDVRVRQAISYAFDRPAMLKSLEGGVGNVTTQVFGPASGAFSSALDSRYAYNVSKAKQLLSAAGYPDGFTLSMPGWVIPAERDAIANYLSAIGVKVNWVTVPAANYVPEMVSGKYEAAVFQVFQGSAWVNYNFLIAPNGPRNVFKSTNAKIDAAEKSILREPTASNVKKQMEAINREVVAQAWFVPFYRISQYYFTGKRVKTVPQVQNAVPYIYNYAPTGK
jgi:peptide/nickel transport system substrate-binding protein